MASISTHNEIFFQKVIYTQFIKMDIFDMKSIYIVKLFINSSIFL